MKYSAIILCLTLVACTRIADRHEAADSIATDSAPPMGAAPTNDANVIFTDANAAINDEAPHDACLEELALDRENISVYKLTASFSGFESSSDVTYHFDSAFNVTYCDASWSMEGTSGSYSYYFRSETLIGGREENNYNSYDETVIFCEASELEFGYRFNSLDTQMDTTHISESEFQSKQNDARNEFKRLLSRISENSADAVIQGDVVTITIENTVNYGDDYTETETFEIDNALFEGFFK